VEFRKVEARLDALVEGSRAALVSHALELEDSSAREYHCKNQVLCWQLEVRKNWVRDIERARITISMTYQEPFSEAEAEVPEVSVASRAELFQQSQLSRIDLRTKKTQPLHTIEHLGITAVIEAAISKAAESLEAAANRSTEPGHGR